MIQHNYGIFNNPISKFHGVLNVNHIENKIFESFDFMEKVLRPNMTHFLLLYCYHVSSGTAHHSTILRSRAEQSRRRITTNPTSSIEYKAPNECEYHSLFLCWLIKSAYLNVTDLNAENFHRHHHKIHMDELNFSLRVFCVVRYIHFN